MNLSHFFNFHQHNHRVFPICLVVLDGYGIAPMSSGNAIRQARTPFINELTGKFPHGKLIASGESVGLPANEVGNSEVGHLTIGAGKPVLQSLKRITRAIKDASFYQNTIFKAGKVFADNNSGAFHIVGLASSGNIHSAIDHLYALLDFCKKENIKKVYLHLFTDGRDAPPQDGIKIISAVEIYIEKLGIGQVASISGRYYSMDRDRRWERTEKSYNAMVSGSERSAENVTNYIKDSYGRGIFDEFIEPVTITKDGVPVGLIKEGDTVVFFNFRIDRPRQLTMAFTLPDFENLKSFKLGFADDQGRTTQEEISGKTFIRKKVLKNIYFATMTEYQKNIPVSGVAFPPHVINGTLPEYLSGFGIPQIHLAESEKERMVTYYFDGLRDERFTGEDVVIIPSPKVNTYDKKPEMSLPAIAKECINILHRDKYPFIMLNIANPDMVAHSGNLPATIKAIECVDYYLGRIYRELENFGGTMLVTSDHGNAEELVNFPSSSYFFTTKSGGVNTEHSNNPVPFYIANEKMKGKPITLPDGTLSDIAPTILTLMKIPIPSIMEGRSLIKLV